MVNRLITEFFEYYTMQARAAWGSNSNYWRESLAICMNFPTYVQVKYWKYLLTFWLSLACSLKEMGINHGKTDRSISNVGL
jgi:hypothetical protein